MGLGFACTLSFTCKDQPIKSIGLGMHGVGWWFAMVCVLAVGSQQGLANKIDRVKNARTSIVQGSWD